MSRKVNLPSSYHVKHDNPLTTQRKITYSLGKKEEKRLLISAFQFSPCKKQMTRGWKFWWITHGWKFYTQKLGENSSIQLRRFCHLFYIQICLSFSSQNMKNIIFHSFPKSNFILPYHPSKRKGLGRVWDIHYLFSYILFHNKDFHISYFIIKILFNKRI